MHSCCAHQGSSRSASSLRLGHTDDCATRLVQQLNFHIPRVLRSLEIARLGGSSSVNLEYIFAEVRNMIVPVPPKTAADIILQFGFLLYETIQYSFSVHTLFVSRSVAGN